MAEQEEDFSSLPLPDRFGHKARSSKSYLQLVATEAWKVRKQVYEDATKQFERTPDERDPAFRPFLQDPGLWKGAVADSNVAAQQEGVAALCAFLKFGGREACLRTRGVTIGPIVEKCLPSTRAAIKTSAIEALLLYIELDVADPVVEDMLPSLSAKQPKVIAATLTALTTIYHSYGCKVVDPKPSLKALPKVFGHADKNVRAEATKLAVEFYRWLREAMKPMFWGDLKPTQQAELEAQFEEIKKANEAPKQDRLLRSQQVAQAKAVASGVPEDAGDAGIDDEPAEVDAFDLAEPQDVLRNVPGDFHEKLASSKWKERKEAAEALYAVLNVPRIKDGDFHEINRGLAKCMKDANIAVVTQAAQCIEVLAKGLRKPYGKYRTIVMQPILERLKEKKQSVADALGAALDQVFLATDLTECLEDITTFLSHKNPQVKEGTMRFLIRCLCATRNVPSKQEITTIVDSAKKLLSESSEGLRSGGAQMLGTIMKIIGERAMNPHIEGLDEIRKTKVKEYFDTAEVKAKEKPKAPPPAPAAGRAPGGGPPKKVVGGGGKKGPSPLKKPVSNSASVAIPKEEPLALQATSRPAGGGSKLGVPKASVKAPQKRALAGPGVLSPRHAAPPPVQDDYDDDPVATTPALQPRIGLGRGGLASRSLAKPSTNTAATVPAPPLSPTPMSGLTALEREELEELRTSNDRLLRQVDDARHERSKLMSEVQELKNQNAGLIEDHTRDVLSIKAKETQLVRARSDAEAAEQTNERLRRELDRLKRALGKAEAAMLNGSGGSSSGMVSPDLTHDDAGIFRDGMYPNNAGRQRMSFASTLSEEKENGETASYARSKMSPDLRYAATGSGTESGRGSPARSYRREFGIDDVSSASGGGYGTGTGYGASSSGNGTSSTTYNGNIGGSGGAGVGGQESWKRAAEVTNQLKARIEQMKARSFEATKMSKAAAADYSNSDSDSDGEDDAYPRPATGPATDEFASYHPRKRRRIGRDAKESAALGIFGSESEDEFRPDRRWKRKPLRKEGVSFVSSGTQEQGSDGAEDDKIEDEDVAECGLYQEYQEKETTREEVQETGSDDDEARYDNHFGGVSFGSHEVHNLGFTSASSNHAPVMPPRAVPIPEELASVTGVNVRNPLGHGFVPSSALDPVLMESVAQSQNVGKPNISAKPSAFSARGLGRSRGGGGGQARFNPKSFGARMMAKMGYVEGSGLGKDEQGRNIIIEANLRPQGAGLGAVKEKSEKERQEEKRQARLRGEAVVQSDDDEKPAKAAARKKRAMGLSGSGRTTSSDTGTPRRQKPKYMTMEEAKRAAPGLDIPDTFTPILDLTGPGRRLLTSSSGLMTPTAGAMYDEAAAEDTAERTKSRKLARRAQADFMAILEEWQSLQNRKAYAELQAQQVRQELSELTDNLYGHKTMAEAFARLSIVDEVAPWKERWDRTIAQLTAAAAAMPIRPSDEMRDALAHISIAAIHPLLKQVAESWEPLQDTGKTLAVGLASVQSLVSRKTQDELPPQHYRSRAIASPYETMMYKIWLPPVSRAVRRWDVQETDSLLELYLTWEPQLPGFVRAQLLEQDIVRKLEEAVVKWEPKRRRYQTQNQSLPHLWLFPWLPYLPSRQLDPKSADGLVTEVKRKFRQLVHVWEFYRGVIPGLREWRDMLRPTADNDQWRPLVMAHVLPSMASYVRAQFRVDPRDQAPYLEVITGEFQWLGLVAAELVGEVMVAEVFPMWHETLYQLLTTPGLASLDRIAQWLQWWADEAFPAPIRQLSSVAAEFERGMVMINEALDLGGNPDLVRLALTPPQKGPTLRVEGPAATTLRDNRHHASHRYRSQQEHHHRHHHRSIGRAGTSPTTAAVTSVSGAGDHEEMSIRHYVEDWCETNDLQFVPERKKVHAEGPLYRITARGDGKGGVLAYFKGLRLYVETKKGPVEVRVDREEDWVQLLSMA
ncbi:spindle pole body component [Grosmannia clavigera kw1407]|uniref:Spindle pole body component n=1 Tax=Grosmannia clavigera (strain kw1407 / UAMH 11150) TaxID=655863 RepID=F0XV74_GROCL|nr:spindle pole body component [Grosmannia clavigera kw1407]EFW98916.1 spindle pole body component [Grosmannia clavigera kw1407]